MDKKEFLKLVDSLNLPKGEFYVLGGGALLVAGLRESTNDLDLCVSKELFEVLRKKYDLKEEQKNKYGFYPISELVEVVPNKKEDFKLMEVNGYPIEDLRQMLAFKEKRNEEKDKKDVEKIKEFLKN